MKKLSTILFLIYASISFAQTSKKIDSSNYYNFLNPPNLQGYRTTTNWLMLNDVIPIMLEELESTGHKWLYDRTIYKLQNGQRIKLSAYSRKSNIGFLYIEGHSAFPNKADRNILFQKDNSKVSYIENEESYTGKAEFIKITELPNNIFVFKEDCYFFQQTDKAEDDKVLITKNIAKSIFREDIKKYLSLAERAKE